MAPQTIEIAENGLGSAGSRLLVRRIDQANSARARRTRDLERSGSGGDPAPGTGDQRAGSEYNLESELRRGKFIFI